MHSLAGRSSKLRASYLVAAIPRHHLAVVTRTNTCGAFPVAADEKNLGPDGWGIPVTCLSINNDGVWYQLLND